MTHLCDSCLKRVFSQGEAKARAREGTRRSRMRKNRREVYESYRCPAGNGWHIGHAHNGRRPKARRR